MHKFRLLQAARGCVLAKQRYNRAVLENDMSNAFSRGELALYYQPIVSTRTERVLGAEALLRWKHGSLGVLSPAAYLHAIEDASCAEDVAQWAISRAIHDAAELNAQGALTINVNLSPKQLLSIPVVALVERELRAARLPPHLLTIEVTEHTMFHNLVVALDVMRDLKSLGIRLALDDFGTGYNGLAQLQSYPLDIVKIDRRFICDVTRSPSSKTICGSMILLGHSLGLRVVAEGIETHEQAQVLRALGCDELQGYYYSQALPKEAFAEDLLCAGC